MSLRRTRLLKELAQLKNFHNENIKLKEGYDGNSGFNMESLLFEMIGPEGTPFAKEHLQLELKLTERYPLEPPILHFITPVRHPNIDETTGRICLDLLRMPPEGSWRPNVNLESVLVSVHVLLGAPNLDDPVRPDLILEWQNRNFEEKENAEIMTFKEDSKKRPSGQTFSLSLSAIRKKSKSQETQ